MLELPEGNRGSPGPHQELLGPHWELVLALALGQLLERLWMGQE